MRPVLALLTGLVLFQATSAHADFEQDLDLEESDYASEAEVADVGTAVRAVNWNRWTCTAHGGPFQIRIFRGQSFYFRGGSGEGQTAKAVAQKIAVRNCEFAGVSGCVSNLAKCTVE